MAGMLPGVESARRRRFHQSSSVSSDSSSSFSSTRRSSFCFYATNNNDSHHFSTLQRNPIIRQAGCEDEKLDEAAREAKVRLDEKLNALWKSQNKRVAKECEEKKYANVIELKKKSNGWWKRFGWTSKWKWKSSEREECVVCLESLKGGEALMQLPCTHRFHSRCLMPWLSTNPHCPSCRLQIPLQLPSNLSCTYLFHFLH